MSLPWSLQPPAAASIAEGVAELVPAPLPSTVSRRGIAPSLCPLGGVPGSILPRGVTVIGPLRMAAGAELLTVSMVGDALALGMPPTLVPGVAVVVVTIAPTGMAILVV